MTFTDENLNVRNILYNVRWPIPILVAKVWWRKLDYAKNLQAKYFTDENIPIYGILYYTYNVMYLNRLLAEPPSLFLSI